VFAQNSLSKAFLHVRVQDVRQTVVRFPAA